jgi:hypothetical protein
LGIPGYEIPGLEIPGWEIPGSEKHGTDIPASGSDMVSPDSEIPDSNIPGSDIPGLDIRRSNFLALVKVSTTSLDILKLARCVLNTPNPIYSSFENRFWIVFAGL